MSKTQLARPCLSISSTITGSSRTKLSTSSAPFSSGISLTATFRLFSRAISGVEAPGALAKLTSLASIATAGNSDSFMSPLIARSRPVAALAWVSIWLL